MLRIVPHLEYLLKVYDCVILPQLGGFVLQSAPATCVVEEGLFTPMHKEVVFNASLKYNDGLLAERYMDAYGVGFQQAYRMLEEDVEEIRSLLFRDLKVSLRNVGTLRREAEGQIVFRSGDAGVFSVDSYGLSAFRLKAWQELQRENEAATLTKKNIYYIPVNRNILRGIASAAAVVALLLMVSTPVKEVNRSSYTASFIPTEIVRVASTDKAKVALPDTAAAIIPVRPAKPAVGLPLYYVVIGSVKTKRQADEITFKAERAGLKNVSKVIVSDKIRVYADKFTDKSKAQAYLAGIKQSPSYRDAWIYTRNK
ncbi:MAG: SPOR domain-containing protein [Tannerellaceae bacterium]|jgi:hypothetical protein|nr:SPOR domain-containing protein [Tannerellaceae bacterium]